MNVSEYSNKLAPAVRPTFEQAVSQDNVGLAVSILVEEGFSDDAIQFCVDSGNVLDAVDIALNCKKLDTAEKICREHNERKKLAEVLIKKGEFDSAADIYIELENYDAAAKIYFNAKKFDMAAQLYETAGLFMNATMCYQKSGNTEKQLEMQIRAFEHDLALANGDLTAVSVSRTMAIYAAQVYLEKEETRQIGLDTLKSAEALDTAANSLLENGKYLEAAFCLEMDGKLREAYDAFSMAGSFENAYRLCNQLDDENLEIETLRKFKKYYRLAQKLAVPEHFDEAVSALKRVDSLDPDFVGALELEGDIYCKQKKFSDAVLCYEQLFWIKLSKEKTCRIAFKAAYCYEAMTDYPNALKAYQKVRSVDPQFKGIEDCIQNVTEKLVEKQKNNTGTDSGIRASTSSFRMESDSNRDYSERMNASVSHRSRKRVNSVMIGDTEVPQIGSTRYKIIEEVAHGGMGVVYKATDTLLMRTVALKVLSQKLKDNEVAMEYFMREARASARLQHINIVTVFDIGALEDGNIYMAMEYVDGKNLKQLIKKTGIFPTNFLFQVAVHACRGLQYAHDHGIIHRDIKSSNIMIARQDKTLKILDLGLAKVLTEDEKGSTQAIGTPYYMSPEQVLGNEIDARSDIYSLGVTLFELAVGTLPFVKGDLPYKHVHEPPPLPSSINPNIDPGLETIILKMMQKNPDDRFSSCSEIISAIKKIDRETEF